MGADGTPMIFAEEVMFSHGLFYFDHIPLVESACDRRMVPSSEEEFNIVKNLYLSCQRAIDTLNTGWFIPRWKEKENEKKDEELNLPQSEVVDLRCQLYAMQAYRDTLLRRCLRNDVKLPRYPDADEFRPKGY